MNALRIGGAIGTEDVAGASEHGQGPLRPRVAPVAVFRGHVFDQLSDLRTPRPAIVLGSWRPPRDLVE
jgi:hypothetical protein